MTTGLPALRALVIYGLCVPLALLLGYLLALPLDYDTLTLFALLLLILSAPLLLKWHQLFLVATINATAVAFFAPGHAQLWQLVAVVSLTISILQLTLSRRLKFVYAPTISRPLFFLMAVVLVTAKFTGGIGFHVLGGENIGGKRYINLFAAILAYFALAARRIPAPKAFLYTGAFFLGGATAFISSLVHFVGPGLSFIFWLFPPEAVPGQSEVDLAAGIPRMGGLGFGSLAVTAFLLSRYGMRGILFSGKLWRPVALLCIVFVSLFGGFRVVLVTILFFLFFQAFLEGVFKSKLMPVLLLGGVLVLAAGLPFVSKLPMPAQRALSVLPLEVSPEARQDALGTTGWRLLIWREVLPDVPKHLLLGEGYLMHLQDWTRANFADSASGFGAAGTIVAGDYHSGPLSLVIPFGIWGVLAFVWLLWAGGRLLYFNYKFGDPALKTINTFLFAAFITETIIYLFVFGGFQSDMIKFTSLLGLSVALNGGRCKPARAPAPEPINLKIRVPMRPAPGLSR
jgi:hypothetical protein